MFLSLYICYETKRQWYFYASADSDSDSTARKQKVFTNHFVRAFVCVFVYSIHTVYWNFFLLFSAININLESLHSVKLCLLRDDKTSRAVYEKQSHHVMYTRECTVHCTVVHRHKFCVKHHVIFTVMYELTLFRKKKIPNEFIMKLYNVQLCERHMRHVKASVSLH